MHTKASLMKDLSNMGLKPTDTLMMHSSMKSIGQVDGGADAVLDALMAYFSPGLLALPALNWQVAELEPEHFYDVQQTRSIVGLLSELFRKRQGVVRSWHPTHSVSAAGQDAQSFTADDHKNMTPCGPTSSWHKLLDRDARILMVGCDLTKCTFIHGVEEWRAVPGRLLAPARFRVMPPVGAPFFMLSCAHDGTPSEQFGRAEAALREGGALVDGQFGDAKCLLLTARATNEVVGRLLAEDLMLFG